MALQSNQVELVVTLSNTDKPRLVNGWLFNISRCQATSIVIDGVTRRYVWLCRTAKAAKDIEDRLLAANLPAKRGSEAGPEIEAV